MSTPTEYILVLNGMMHMVPLRTTVSLCRIKFACCRSSWDVRDIWDTQKKFEYI